MSRNDEDVPVASSHHSNKNQTWYQKLCRLGHPVLDEQKIVYPSPQRLQLQMHFQRHYQQLQEQQKNCRQEWWTKKTSVTPGVQSSVAVFSPANIHFCADASFEHPKQHTPPLQHEWAPPPVKRYYYRPSSEGCDKSSQNKRHGERELFSNDQFRRMLETAVKIKTSAEKRIQQTKQEVAINASERDIYHKITQVLKAQQMAEQHKNGGQLPRTPGLMPVPIAEQQHMPTNLYQTYNQAPMQNQIVDHRKKWQEQITIFKSMLEANSKGDLQQSYQFALLLLSRLLKDELNPAQMSCTPDFFSTPAQAHTGPMGMQQYNRTFPQQILQPRRDPCHNQSNKQYQTSAHSALPRRNTSYHHFDREQDITPEITYQRDTSGKTKKEQRISTPRKQLNEETSFQGKNIEMKDYEHPKRELIPKNSNTEACQGRRRKGKRTADNGLVIMCSSKREGRAIVENQDNVIKQMPKERVHDFSMMQQKSQQQCLGRKHLQCKKEYLFRDQEDRMMSTKVSEMQVEKSSQSQQVKEGDIWALQNKNVWTDSGRSPSSSDNKIPEDWQDPTSEPNARSLLLAQMKEKKHAAKKCNVFNGQNKDEKQHIDCQNEKGSADAQPTFLAYMQDGNSGKITGEMSARPPPEDNLTEQIARKTKSANLENGNSVFVASVKETLSQKVCSGTESELQASTNQIPQGQLLDGQQQHCNSYLPSQNLQPPQCHTKRSSHEKQQSSVHPSSNDQKIQRSPQQNQETPPDLSASKVKIGGNGQSPGKEAKVRGTKSSGKMDSKSSEKKSPGATFFKPNSRRSPGNVYVVRNSSQKSASSKAQSAPQSEKSGSTTVPGCRDSSPKLAASKLTSNCQNQTETLLSGPKPKRQRARRRPERREESEFCKENSGQEYDPNDQQHTLKYRNSDVQQSQNSNWYLLPCRRPYQWDDSKVTPVKKHRGVVPSKSGPRRVQQGGFQSQVKKQEVQPQHFEHTDFEQNTAESGCKKRLEMQTGCEELEFAKKCMTDAQEVDRPTTETACCPAEINTAHYQMDSVQTVHQQTKNEEANIRIGAQIETDHLETNIRYSSARTSAFQSASKQELNTTMMEDSERPTVFGGNSENKSDLQFIQESDRGKHSDKAGDKLCNREARTAVTSENSTADDTDTGSKYEKVLEEMHVTQCGLQTDHEEKDVFNGGNCGEYGTSTRPENKDAETDIWRIQKGLQHTGETGCMPCVTGKSDTQRDLTVANNMGSTHRACIISATMDGTEGKIDTLPLDDSTKDKPFVNNDAEDGPEVEAIVSYDAEDGPEIEAIVNNDAEDTPEVEAIVNNDAEDTPEIEAIVNNDAEDRPEIETIVNNDAEDRPEIETIVNNDAEDTPENGTGSKNDQKMEQKPGNVSFSVNDEEGKLEAGTDVKICRKNQLWGIPTGVGLENSTDDRRKTSRKHQAGEDLGLGSRTELQKNRHETTTMLTDVLGGKEGKPETHLEHVLAVLAGKEVCDDEEEETGCRDAQQGHESTSEIGRLQDKIPEDSEHMNQDNSATGQENENLEPASDGSVPSAPSALQDQPSQEQQLLQGKAAAEPSEKTAGTGLSRGDISVHHLQPETVSEFSSMKGTFDKMNNHKQNTVTIPAAKTMPLKDLQDRIAVDSTDDQKGQEKASLHELNVCETDAVPGTSDINEEKILDAKRCKTFHMEEHTITADTDGWHTCKTEENTDKSLGQCSLLCSKNLALDQCAPDLLALNSTCNSSTGSVTANTENFSMEQKQLNSISCPLECFLTNDSKTVSDIKNGQEKKSDNLIKSAESAEVGMPSSKNQCHYSDTTYKTASRQTCTAEARQDLNEQKAQETESEKKKKNAAFHERESQQEMHNKKQKLYGDLKHCDLRKVETNIETNKPLENVMAVCDVLKTRTTLETHEAVDKRDLESMHVSIEVKSVDMTQRAKCMENESFSYDDYVEGRLKYINGDAANNLKEKWAEEAVDKSNSKELKNISTEVLPAQQKSLGSNVWEMHGIRKRVDDMVCQTCGRRRKTLDEYYANDDTCGFILFDRLTANGYL